MKTRMGLRTECALPWWILVLLLSLAGTASRAAPLRIEATGQWDLGLACSEHDPASPLPQSEEASSTTRTSGLRLMPTFHAGGGHRLVLHYESRLLEGSLTDWRPTGDTGLGLGGPPDDRRRVMDLTRVFHRQGTWTGYHRLDRLAYHHRASWGSLTIGREAITWGNGILFNPMDLFNPFAPTDVERNYKAGDDLVLLNLGPANWNGGMDWQVLAVPRRHPQSGNLSTRESSLALKAHAFTDSAEWDLLLAIHRDEPILAIGRSGYFGQAVWRSDFVAGGAGNGDTLLAAVLNLDLSWSAFDRNWYGALEFHYTSIGEDDPADAGSNSTLLERLFRGEQHTLGHAYLGGTLQCEVHPLLNAHATAIVNLGDPSGIFQPRLVWSPRQNLEVTLGGSIHLGPEGTEFGGLSPTGNTGFNPRPDRAYLRLEGFF